LTFIDAGVSVRIDMARKRTAQSEATSRRVQSQFGRRLQETRRARETKTTQEELAEALGVTRTSVSNIERGQHRVFLDQLYVAARTLGVPITDLLPTMEEIYGDSQIALAAGSGVGESSAQKAFEVVLRLQERNSAASVDAGKRRKRHEGAN
jgi:transcriptional regulator with XRE-family HTH domain